MLVFLVIIDVYDDSTTGLLQRFEDERLLLKRELLSIEKLIGQGKWMLSINFQKQQMCSADRDSCTRQS